MKKVIVAVGTRPNLIKMAPLVKELSREKVWYIIVDTGQHYDENLSKIFFKQFNILEAEVNLNVGSGTHGQQLAKIITGFEKVCKKEEPEVVITIGDTNSSLGCALAAAKCKGVKVVHVEAGERCDDLTMPEEINRRVIDHISDCLFCTNLISSDNLLKEGIDESKIFVVGNPVIDSIVENWDRLDEVKVPLSSYCLFTMHRQSNTDNKENLINILTAAQELSSVINVIFPIHPRTLQKIKKYKLENYLHHLSIFQPFGYLEMLAFLRGSKFVMTDSGGIQLESAYIGIPCITLRDVTEWTFTVSAGVNCLVGCDTSKILTEAFKHLNKRNSLSSNFSYFDGKSSQRIVKVLKERYNV
jgi:UDP-N-acetylglucosamine 2-epimerase (non-hydrolysing)